MSDSADKKIMSVEDYTQMIASDITSEVYKFIRFYEKKVGVGTGQNLVGAFIQELLFRTVLDTLEGHPKGPDKDRYVRTMNDFTNFKSLLQEAIAYGFADAVSKFSGKNMDYYCNLTPVPEPDSKLLN